MNTAPLIIINVVGLTRRLLGDHTPCLNRLVADGSMTQVSPVFPALTTTAQTTMLTGAPPADHGIVGNGWYWRDMSEVHFWQQSSHLVQRPRVWDTLKQNLPDFSCANLFWWFNMYADVDYSVTPRPHYPADGRKIVDLYSSPNGLHQKLEQHLGKFPFFNFWGPASDIRSSRWIAEAAKLVFQWHRPDLQLVYLPHLDYNLQRLGPDAPGILDDVSAIDGVVGDLAGFYQKQGAETMIVSEYGLTQVDKPVHINRVLREQGYLQVRESVDWELLDAGASGAFAVADHQVAHIYVRQASDILAVKELVETIPGVEQVLDEREKQAFGIDHARSGELVAIASANAWFTYYYWFEDDKAPDFARTVDIHRKPGYDPAELFLDPELIWPKLKIFFRLVQKTMGMRMLMDVIPLQAELVRGSHGRLVTEPMDQPILISNNCDLVPDGCLMTDIHGIILNYFGVST